MKVNRILLAAIAAAVIAPACAQVPPRWYAGISAGQSKTDSELVHNRESTLVNAVPASISTQFDATAGAWKVFGGFHFNEIFAVELSYADLGRHRLTTSFVGGDPVLPGSMTIRRKVTGFGADAVFTAPLGHGFAIFGRAGAFRTRLQADAELDGSVVFTNVPGDRRRAVTQNETIGKFGIGADWWFAPNMAARLEWERYHNIGKAFAIGGSGTTGEADTDSVTLGVLIRF